ncbi:hypothetical protein C8Q75DRAFT_477746 [Abortiporus biennis]|nr:hypothetical protein C8Q75DRAFT_477746 [Abortiporus biennis]
MNEQLQRMLTRNPLVPLAVVLFGSVWFAISIVVFCLGLLFPSIRAQPPPTVSTSTPRQRRRNGAVHLSTSSANNHPYPSMLVPKQPHPDSHVNFPGIQSITPPTRIKRWSSPGFLPPASAYQDIDSTESFADSSLASVSNFARVDETASFDASPSSTVSTLPEDMPSRRTSLSSYHKRVLSTRLPGMNVFRTRSKKSEKDGVHSRSSSIASTSSLSSAAPSPNSSPTRKSVELPESGETYRTSFVSPFKFRPKRSSASAALILRKRFLYLKK